MRPILWPFLMPLQICHIRLEHPCEKRQKPVCKTVANDTALQFGEWPSVSGHLSRRLPAKIRLIVFFHSSTFGHLPLLPCSQAVMTAKRYTTFISQLMSEGECLIEKNYSSAVVTNRFQQEYSNKCVIYFYEQMFTNFVVDVAGNGYVTCRTPTSAHSYIGIWGFASIVQNISGQVEANSASLRRIPKSGGFSDLTAVSIKTVLFWTEQDVIMQHCSDLKIMQSLFDINLLWLQQRPFLGMLEIGATSATAPPVGRRCHYYVTFELQICRIIFKGVFTKVCWQLMCRYHPARWDERFTRDEKITRDVFVLHRERRQQDLDLVCAHLIVSMVLSLSPTLLLAKQLWVQCCINHWDFSVTTMDGFN